ncbi:MAG: hypothetical protein QM499_05460 [Flavobacteriaceae bacterium]
MKYTKLFLLFIITVTLAGCSIKEYYFPMAELVEGKIYTYECKAEPSNTEFWKLTSNLTDNTLITEAFNSDYKQYEFFKEQLNNNGAILLEFISYRSNENEQNVSAVINKPIDLDVFKWKTDNPYKYSSETIDENYGKVIFEKKREFLEEVKLTVLEKEHKALKFKESYKTVVSKTKQKYEYSQFSYYAKGIGLVKMEKEYPDGAIQVLELTKILSIPEWEKEKLASN